MLFYPKCWQTISRSCWNLAGVFTYMLEFWTHEKSWNFVAVHKQYWRSCWNLTGVFTYIHNRVEIGQAVRTQTMFLNDRVEIYHMLKHKTSRDTTAATHLSVQKSARSVRKTHDAHGFYMSRDLWLFIDSLPDFLNVYKKFSCPEHNQTHLSMQKAARIPFS